MTAINVSGIPPTKIRTARGVGRIIAAPASGRGPRAAIRSGVSPSISALGDIVSRWREHRQSEDLHVVGNDEVATLQNREGAHGGRQHVGGAGRCPDFERGMLARRADHVDDVVDQRLGEANEGHRLAHRRQRRRVGDRLEPKSSSRGMAERWP